MLSLGSDSVSDQVPTYKIAVCELDTLAPIIASGALVGTAMYLYKSLALLLLQAPAEITDVTLSI